MNVFGRIVGQKQEGKELALKVNVPFDEHLIDTMSRYKVNGKILAEIKVDDGRTITVDQRKKAYALIRDLADYTGYVPEEMKEIMKYHYLAESGEKHFSLSDCSVTTAREFIDYMLNFAFQHDMAFTYSLEDAEPKEVRTFMYLSLRYRKCAVCGRRADVHHAFDDKVGMGRDREEIVHVGLKAVALCREHHNVVHANSEKDFYDKHHLVPIMLDDVLVKVLNMD